MAITLPNLGLKVWNSPDDPYNSAQLAQNWYRVDEHDHSPGKGRPLASNSLADYSVTNIKIADKSVDSRTLKPQAGAVRGLQQVLPLASVGTEVFVPGCNVTVTPTVASRLLVTCHFAYQISGSATTAVAGLIGRIIVDGVVTSPYADTYEGPGTTNWNRHVMAAQTWSVPLTPGSHLIESTVIRNPIVGGQTLATVMLDCTNCTMRYLLIAS